MSKSKNNELKFSIRNLIGTTSCEKPEKSQANGIHHPQSHRSLKRLVTEPATSFIRRPIPIINQKTPHPCWSFLTQLTNKNANGSFPFNSSLMFLSKMSQAWEEMQRTQILPSFTTDKDEASDAEDIDLDTTSIRQDTDDEEEEEEDDDDEGECSSSGDKLNPSSNSDDNEKLKNYPCTHCGKVGLALVLIKPSNFLFT